MSICEKPNRRQNHQIWPPKRVLQFSLSNFHFITFRKFCKILEIEIRTPKGVIVRKTCIGVFGILACAASPLCADGYCLEDRELIAGKGIFPGDGSDDEGALPEADMTDDSGNTNTAPDTTDDGDVTSKAKSNNPRGGKDVYPQERSTNGKAN